MLAQWNESLRFFIFLTLAKSPCICNIPAQSQNSCDLMLLEQVLTSQLLHVIIIAK